MTFLKKVRYFALNLVAKPVGLTFFPKEKIECMEGGNHLFEKEEHIVLFNNPPWQPSRKIIIKDKKGKEVYFYEIVESSMAGQELIILQK